MGTDQRGQVFAYEIVLVVAVLFSVFGIIIYSYWASYNALSEFHQEFKAYVITYNIAETLLSSTGIVVSDDSYVRPWTGDPKYITREYGSRMIVPGIAAFNAWEKREYQNYLDKSKIIKLNDLLQNVLNTRFENIPEKILIRIRITYPSFSKVENYYNVPEDNFNLSLNRHLYSQICTITRHCTVAEFPEYQDQLSGFSNPKAIPKTSYPAIFNLTVMIL